MLERVRQTIRRYELLEPGDKVVVGVSGGPDSLALLHVLNTLREEFCCTLHVAHLNHCLRPDAEADAEYVRKLAAEWGLEATIEGRDVAAYQRAKHLSLEEAAREVRYSFLQEVAAAVGATKIAVGHQADDQAETVLLNLLRGSGLTGLKAMVPRRGQIIRPLLFISREEIEEYCQRQGINPRRDFTNEDLTLRRNKIRHLLLPFLAREFNPAIIRALSRTAVILQEEEEILAGLAKEAFNGLLKEKDRDGKNLVLNRQKMLTMPVGLQRRVLRLAASALGRTVDFEQVEGAREAALRGGVISWPGHLKVEARETELVFILPQEKARFDGFFHYLQVPGLTPIPEAGWAIRAEVTAPPSVFSGGEDEAWLDWDKIHRPLIVRNWRPGDKFHPLGMVGRKKLQDFFSDIRFPVARRRLVPVIVCGEHIAWVAGLRLADDFKITPATRRALHLKLEPWP
ncbi:tRNA lysidine(34) synthetase TilS [Neomoorella humiferrea]|uniref:tRNA(Ile)-lysidine synthase n=1 Tax=Neomoorella humiferrea TaxID=676965 RepID=A0A2T0ATW0_9FIRM|nr:tRNA lysidine(34) synthetase TilS [Moorella humiferrea]PRR73908.1 tRNA(Ile)-lysidine synthase [Moorella humiferrea]